MNKSRLVTTLHVTGKIALKSLLVIFRIIVAILTPVIKSLTHFPNAIVITLVGLAVTFGLSRLPGILSLLWYVGAAGTLILAIRGAWTDLTVTSSENRIAARTMDAVARASQKDQP